MADIIESEVFESGIYQLEITDPVLGGENGISNRQAKQLANRTKWLKAKVDLILGGTFEAAKAVVLKTARKINGVDFDGSANITLPTVNTSGDQEVLGIKNFTDGVKVKGENVSPFTGFKNYLINGNFDVWQYGTSQTSAGYGSDDRWNNYHNGSTKTHARVLANDNSVVGYISRTVVASVAGANNYVDKFQRIEDVARLAGKTITVSFKAKADAPKKLAIVFYQNFGTGGTPSADVIFGGQTIDITSAWATYQITVDVPSITGKTIGSDGVHTSYLSFAFFFDAGSTIVSTYGLTGMVQQSGTFDIAEVQIEKGSLATTNEKRPYGLELSLCQRYYENSYPLGSFPGALTFLGAIAARGTNATSNSGYIQGVAYFKVAKRAIPSLTLYNPNSGAAGTWRSSGSILSDISINAYISSNNFRYENVVQCDFLQGHWAASAEL